VAPSDHLGVLEHLRTTGRDLVSLISGVDDSHLHRSPGEAEWSATQVISHLADAELVYGTRMRLIVTEPTPHLAAYDENAWVERFSELDDDPRATLARWRALRDSNVRILESLEPAEWQLFGIHAETGRMTVDTIAERMVAHDKNHLDQIRRALAG
jgi:hypothetical protein